MRLPRIEDRFTSSNGYEISRDQRPNAVGTPYSAQGCMGRHGATLPPPQAGVRIGTAIWHPERTLKAPSNAC
jgi:hypothetical protein